MPGTVMVGLRVRPGAVPAIFGVPAVELVDGTVRLDDVWQHTAMLGEQMAEAASHRAAAALLEAAVREGLCTDTRVDPAAVQTVERLVAEPTTDVAAVATALDISQRQLRRRCETAIGLPPKAVHRMLRFQGLLALTRAYGEARPNLSILAAEAGYADQAHLTQRRPLRSAAPGVRHPPAVAQPPG